MIKYLVKKITIVLLSLVTRYIDNFRTNSLRIWVHCTKKEKKYKKESQIGASQAMRRSRGPPVRVEWQHLKQLIKSTRAQSGLSIFDGAHALAIILRTRDERIRAAAIQRARRSTRRRSGVFSSRRESPHVGTDHCTRPTRYQTNNKSTSLSSMLSGADTRE